MYAYKIKGVYETVLFLFHDGFIAGEEIFDCLELPEYKTNVFFHRLLFFMI